MVPVGGAVRVGRNVKPAMAAAERSMFVAPWSAALIA
jgi:hypothetical protein